MLKPSMLTSAKSARKLPKLASSSKRAGLEIRGCQEPRAPLTSPAAPSNFCREPKDVPAFYTEHLQVAFEDAVGLPG